MHFNPRVYEFSQVCPVFEISRAPVNFMNDDARSIAQSEQLQHFGPDRSAFLRSSLLLLEPGGDMQSISRGVSLNRFSLFGERYPALSLSYGGDTDIATALFQCRFMV